MFITLEGSFVEFPTPREQRERVVRTVSAAPAPLMPRGARRLRRSRRLRSRWREKSKGSMPLAPFPSPLRPRTSQSKGSVSAAPSMSPRRRGSEGSASPRCPRHRRAAGAAGAKARSLISPSPVPVSFFTATAFMGDHSLLSAPSAIPRSLRRQTGRDVPPRPLSPRSSRQRAA